jgi:hypothetical protein
MRIAKARSYCPYGEVCMHEYTAWFDGASKPVNPGGTATFGMLAIQGYKPRTGTFSSTRVQGCYCKIGIVCMI